MNESPGLSPHAQPPHGHAAPPPEFLDLPPDPPAWPKVIGIISIVFGSLGITCNGCGGVMLVATPFFMKMGEEQFGPAPDVMKPPLAQIVMIPISLALSLLLLCAGIALLRRKPIARMLHIVNAVLSILLTGASIVIGLQQLDRLGAWKAANPTDKWAQQLNMDQQHITFALMVFFGLAYPLFLLVWFGLVKRNASDMGKLPEYL